ncbi:MAG: enoyl-CoA hydratase/isomerase family protein [Nevskiales bacterium]
MSELLPIQTAEELAGWALAGPAPVAFSPLGEHKALLLALSSQDDAAAAEWLSGLMCPVIGLGDVESALAPYCDVLVADETEAAALLDKITANPVAATTFVELLRITESLPLQRALRLESLAYATLQAGSDYAAWLQQLKQQPQPPAEDGPAVLLERQGAELQMVLNRPGNRNAMSVEMRDALNEALQLVITDEAIETVRISGAGKCFSTGGDLSEFGTVPDAATGHIVRGLSVPGALLARCANKVTAHVHGACIGSGVEFPAFAGRITASANTHFQLPEVGMGLIPGAGGCISIARRMGRQRTAWLGLSGKRIKATQALQWGLVDEIVD